VSHAVTNGGQLGTAVIGGFWEDYGEAALDAEDDVPYKSRSGGDYSSSGALTSHIVELDGRLKTMGTTSLCGDSEVASVSPLVAVRGFVFGREAYGDGTVCSWKGLHLAPLAKLGISAGVAAGFSPSDGGAPAMLAMANDVFTPQNVYLRTDLRLLSMESDGEVALLDTVEVPGGVGQLLFHPSGHFLYVADADGDDRLSTYSVSAGRLQPIESVPDAARPSGYLLPSFMAVSVRSNVPRP
jgi:hypothetical protein